MSTALRTKPVFNVRSCGHSVPSGRMKCPYCIPPRMSAAPLAEALRQRASVVGYERMSFEIASRLGMQFGRVERHIRRIVAGDVRHVAFDTADKFCVALGGVMPATLWGDEWNDASPVEPYGDEEW